MYRDVNYELIQYRKKDKKKPAAFYFLRSLALTTDVLLHFVSQKSRRVGESGDVSPCAALQRERIDIYRRKDFKQKKASNFLLSRQRAVSSA